MTTQRRSMFLLLVLSGVIISICMGLRQSLGLFMRPMTLEPEVRKLILRQQGVEEGHIPIPRRMAPSAAPHAAPSDAPVAPDPSPPARLARKSAAPRPASRHAISGVHPGDLREFQEVALRVLAHSGGWNESAKRRLGALAHAYGLDMDQLRRVLKGVADERTSGTRRTGAGRTPSARTEPRLVSGAVGVLPESWRKRLAIATIVLFALTALMGIWLLAMVVSGPGKVPERTVIIRPGAKDKQGATSEGGTQGAAGDTSVTPPASPAPDVQQAIQPATSLEISSGQAPKPPGAPADLLEKLRAAQAILANDPDGATKVFTEILGDVGARWTEIEPATLQALRVELSNFLLAAIRADREAALASSEAIEAPAEGVAAGTPAFGRADVAQAVFSAGLLARLNRDDLISSIGSSFRNVLVRLSNDGSGARRRDFWPGVALGLEALARQYVGLSSDREKRAALGRGWSAWIECLERLRAEDAPGGEQLLLDTIERALVEGPDPAMSQSAHDALSRLVGLLDFVGPNGRASQRLIMWFDDSRIPTSGLSLVTSRIVFSSLIPGFGPEMMLRPDATEAARSQLRDDYALKLGLPVSSEDRALSDVWRARARQVLENRPISEDSVAALERAGALAMLNVSATLRWAGEDDKALEAAKDARIKPLVENAVEVVEQSLGPEAPLTRMTSPSRYPDGDWARRYLASIRNPGEKQDLINELRNGDTGPRGPVDADVLSEAACYGGPATLRRSAQDTVEKYADNAFVINALLETMPNAARTSDVSSMVERVSGRSLPSTRDPAWRGAARRALLERMVEMLGRRLLTQVEALESVMRRSYEDRAAASGASKMLTPASGSGAPPTLADASPAELAGALRDEMAAHARQFSEGPWTITPLNVLEQRHQARVRLARGGLQEFAAEQLGLTEMMAYVVAAERTSKSDEVRAVLDELTARRRAAPHVFHQIEASEEAMLKLWLIRLGEEATA